jgi:hypothetical protein
MQRLHFDVDAAAASRSLPELPPCLPRKAVELTHALPTLRLQPLEVAQAVRHRGLLQRRGPPAVSAKGRNPQRSLSLGPLALLNHMPTPTMPRGGVAGSVCACCYAAHKNKRLRSCATCGVHYCGRRVCRAWHTLACGPHRPHWPGYSKGATTCVTSPTALRIPISISNANSVHVPAAVALASLQDAQAAMAPGRSVHAPYGKPSLPTSHSLSAATNATDADGFPSVKSSTHASDLDLPAPSRRVYFAVPRNARKPRS